MTKSAALRILGLSSDYQLSQLKTSYRKLMLKVHPDSATYHTNQRKHPGYTASDVNEAYHVLLDLLTGQDESDDVQTRQSSSDSSGQKQPMWNAPVNSSAFCDRTIFHFAEGPDGETIGAFPYASGRYLWIPEESFSLFLKSITSCTFQLLVRYSSGQSDFLSDEERIAYQTELIYLLAQQFIDLSVYPDILGTPEKQKGCTIFYVKAMLERSASLSKPLTGLQKGASLFPAYLKSHRLFLKDTDGSIAGYLSFKDDRLYYILIPLFEQRKVQLKIRIADSPDKSIRPSSRRKTAARTFLNLDLWIRFPDIENAGPPESLTLQIEQLLSDYQSGKPVHCL